MEGKEYIHYGHRFFDKNLFRPIKNRGWMPKPWGGLWASSVDAEFGWKDWNRREKYVKCLKSNSFTFTLKPETRVFVIDSIKNLEVLCRRYLIDNEFGNILMNAGTPDWLFEALLGIDCAYDFEKMMQDYDAIEFYISKEPKLYSALYGWDCDSLLVMNADCVVPTEKKSGEVYDIYGAISEQIQEENEEKGEQKMANNSFQNMYGIWHIYDVDNGYGDAMPQQELVAVCADEELANKYADMHSNPHVYDEGYNDLYEGELIVRPMNKIIVVTQENVDISPFSAE